MKKPFLVIIDEESDNLELLQYNFMRRGIHVRTFSHPGKALKFLRERQPDMIICDRSVGTDKEAPLCMFIRKDPLFSRVPLVVTSYQEERSAIQYTLESGAIDYIVKPIKAYDLVTRIERLMVPRQKEEV